MLELSSQVIVVVAVCKIGSCFQSKTSTIWFLYWQLTCQIFLKMNSLFSLTIKYNNIYCGDCVGDARKGGMKKRKASVEICRVDSPYCNALKGARNP